MSMDLIVRGASLEAVEELPRAHDAAELHAGEGHVLVVLKGGDEAVHGFALGLMAAAMRSGWTVHDPQRGRDVARLSELGLTPPNVSGDALETLIKGWTTRAVAPLGFAQVRPRMVQRWVDGLVQGVEFLPPRHDRLAARAFWTLRPDGDRSSATSYAGTRTLSDLGSPPGIVIPATPLEEGFSLLTRELEDHVVPWLTRYAGIPALLAGLDRGELEPRQTLGADPGWQAFHHGACLRYVGRQAEARARFAEVVEQHSDRPYPWVQERRAAAERHIAEL